VYDHLGNNSGHLPEHRDGLPEGWQYCLERIRELAESENRRET
jgi:hypothetical protein